MAFPMRRCGYSFGHNDLFGRLGPAADLSEEVTRMYIGIGTLIVVIVLLIILL
ncbi:MAG TPA: hypothetical protein VK964_00340 [Nocardioidaceae bacterium]|jgi:hypothetical protein|nr:hypothetical protein [Nocardioidaceae bacterium]